MAVAGYQYRKKLTSEPTTWGSPVDMGLPSPLEFLVTGLTEDTSYDFEIRAYDDALNYSDWSSPVTESTEAPVPGLDSYENIGAAVAFSPYVADAAPSASSSDATAGGISAADLTGLTDPAPAGVYTTKRYANPPTGFFTYSFTVTPGATYKVRIHHNVETASQNHIVTINGVAQTTYDPYTLAGSVNYKGYIKEFTVVQGGGSTMTVKVAGDGSSYAGANGISIIEQ